MKKVNFSTVTVAIMAGIILICSPGLVTGKGLPRMLTLGTMPVGTSVNMAGSGIAVLVNAHTPMNVKVMPVSNEAVWIPMMATDEVQLGVGLMPEVEFAVLGQRLWEKGAKRLKIKGFPVRIVALGAKCAMSFNVRGDSPIKSIPDLKGKRVCRLMPKSGVQDFILASLANGNLTPDDIKFIPVANPVEAGKALMDGRVDASYTAPDAPIIMEMVSKVKARYLPHVMDEAGQARVKAVNHQLRVELPEVLFPHVLEEKIPLLVFDWALFAAPKVSDDAIYEIIKAMYENVKELNEKPALNTWKATRFCSDKVYVPYHEGAVKYYKEKGLWNDKVENVQRSLLKKIDEL
jgi:TRAP transporter TAXI family solute receptor